MVLVYKIHNVLSSKERKKIIKDIQPFLMDSEQLGKYYNTSRSFPGKQTISNLHQQSQFVSVIKKIEDIIKKEINLDLEVTKSWVKYSNSDTQLNWHIHHCDYASVYYMKTPLPFFSNGTLFRKGLFKAPQNSIIVFPGSMEHTAPSSPFRFNRYSLAMELNIRT